MTPDDTGPDVLAELRRAGVGDVDGSSLARALYSTDASLYRVPPQVVVRPRHVDEVLAALDVARRTGVPLTMRGAGTSIAGQRRRARHRRGHRQAPEPGARGRPGGRHGPGRARCGARRAAAGRRAARPAVRAGPLDAHPLHDRRDDRQQRLRLARPRLRPHLRQRRRPRRGDRRRGAAAGRIRRARRHDVRRPRGAGRRAPGDRPHRARPFPAAGLRLRAGAPAARERPPGRQVPGRQRGHPRRGARSHRPPGP